MCNRQEKGSREYARQGKERREYVRQGREAEYMRGKFKGEEEDRGRDEEQRVRCVSMYGFH